MKVETTLRVYDVRGGEVLAELRKVFSFKRYSMACAAKQKALDGLLAKHPTAGYAEIQEDNSPVPTRFLVRGGKSSAIFQ